MPASDETGRRVAARLREYADGYEGQGFNACSIGAVVCNAIRGLADCGPRTTSGYLRALAGIVDGGAE